MALPERVHPQFDITLPSNGKKLHFRPFMVREEKIFLMAAASNQYNEILRAIKQIIATCLVEDYDVERMTLFDIEYFFLQLRARSVNNIVEQTYRDKEDDKLYTFKIDLDQVKVVFPEQDKNIRLSEDMGVVMKYPTTVYTKEFLESKTAEEAKFQMIMMCLEKLWAGEEVHYFSDEKPEDMATWLDTQVGPNEYDQMLKFVNDLPHLEHRIKYKNSLGNDREIVLETLTDFFILG